MKKEDEIRELLPECEDILSSGRFQKAKRVRHHKKFNVAAHSMQTAVYGARLCGWLNRHGAKIDKRDVIRACLLHDIGMTEDQVHDSVQYRKAFAHPKKSVEIAAAEYGANEVQLDAVRRHMWPICVIPPKHVAGWLVVAADKMASCKEVLRMMTLPADSRAGTAARQENPNRKSEKPDPRPENQNAKPEKSNIMPENQNRKSE